MDKFEYVMHGKVFKIGEDRTSVPSKTTVYASFGGLLMLLKGEQNSLAQLEVDRYIYILLRRM